MNRLTSASTVISNQVQNLSAAEDGIRAADIPSEVANLTKYNILSQTGISALAQANQMQQSVLSLLKYVEDESARVKEARAALFRNRSRTHYLSQVLSGKRR
jgi:hypothetical protein